MSQECQCKVRQHEGRRAEDREEEQAREKAWEAYLGASGWPVQAQRYDISLALNAALTAYRAALCEIALRRLGVRGTR